MQATTVSPFGQLRGELEDDLRTGYDELIARSSWDRATIVAHQRRRLRRLLRTAVERSPFHARRLAGLDLDAIGPEDLSALPVMTKAELMASFDEVVTDRSIRLADVEAALARAADEPAVLPGTVLALTSGGSCGPRGVFLLDRLAVGQFIGSLSRSLVARLRVTGTPPGGLRMAMIAAASPVHATRMAVELTRGGALGFWFEAVPVTLPLADLVDRLQAVQPHALYGYPTTIARLALEQQAGRLRIAPQLVTCTAETLTAELRATIRAGFGVPIGNTFACTEQLVGVSAPDDEAVVFAEDGCIVEPVDAADRPVPPGVPSTSVLVTVLENRLQPLIRYRLHDSVVVLPPDPAGAGHLRALARGRADEVRRFGDVTLHPLVLRSVLVHSPEVADYQVRQTPGGLTVSVLAPDGLNRSAVAGQLTAALTAAGLPGIAVSVQTVPSLPRDERTGKLRRFVPLG
jgi:phenylacetate-CoA ligase